MTDPRPGRKTEILVDHHGQVSIVCDTSELERDMQWLRDALRPDRIAREVRAFRRWQIRCAARARKARRGWR